MSIIDTINSNIPSRINKNDETYIAIFGNSQFTPEVTVLDPDDIKCGAICNELEFLKIQIDDLVDSFKVENAQGSDLDTVIMSLVDLKRRGTIESDALYSNRFKTLITQNTHESRCTRWAIIDALSYLIDPSGIDVIELFDSRNNYFQVRLRSTVLYTDSIFVDIDFIDNDFIAGAGIGSIQTYVNALINRIKPAGVEYETIYVEKHDATKTSYALFDSAQKYLSSLASIKHIESVTKGSYATIV